MNDPTIRKLLEVEAPRWFTNHALEGTRIDELSIAGGSTRADIAILGSRFRAFEIKSASDSLVRLQSQVPAYNLLFDYSTLIVAERHTKQAQRLIPPNWGLVMVKSQLGSKRILDELRPPRLNRSMCPATLSTLLWRSELIELLTSAGVDLRTHKNATKEELIKLIQLSITISKIKRSVALIISARGNWRHRRPLFRYDD